VREFVQGISRLKLVKAHTIMEPIAAHPGPFDGAPRAAESVDLDHLIDLSVGSDQPIVITDGGAEVGVVTKTTLLRGIQGGKA
jgi:glycine betaine/proline transport system ATP-binding protein